MNRTELDTDAAIALVHADDWPGARASVTFDRPADWRDVPEQLRWDLAIVAAGWAHLEAADGAPARLRSLRQRLGLLAATIADDLPFLLGVGPTGTVGEQPQLPLMFADDPPLEQLGQRPGELTWLGYFSLPLTGQLDRILERSAPERRTLALTERGFDASILDDLGDAARYHDLLTATFPPDAPLERVDRWARTRNEEDERLARGLVGQVALQLECLLRGRPAPVVALFEEAVALGLEDAALGAALHVQVDDAGAPTGLVFVSHDGRPRSVVPTRGAADDPLLALVTRAGEHEAPAPG